MTSPTLHKKEAPLVCFVTWAKLLLSIKAVEMVFLESPGHLGNINLNSMGFVSPLLLSPQPGPGSLAVTARDGLSVSGWALFTHTASRLLFFAKNPLEALLYPR